MKKIVLMTVALVMFGATMWAADIQYAKVNNTSSLKDGDVIVLVSEAVAKVNSGKDTGSTPSYLTTVALQTDASNNVLLDKEQAAKSEITLKSVSGGWNMLIKNQYIGTKEAKKLYFSSSFKNGYTYDWSITIDNGDAIMTAGYGDMRCNPDGAGRFTTYTSGYGKEVQIYRRIADQEVHVTSVEVSPSSATLLIGKQTTLTATVLPEDADFQDVTWSSNNTAVATVSSSGVVKAIAAGTAIITATADGKSGSATITVKAEQSFTLNMVTNTAQLKAGSKVAFANAKYDKAMGLYASGNNIKAVAATFSGDRGTMTIPEECVYTVETKNGQYAFKDANGLYLYSWSGNKLGAQEDVFYWTAEVRKTNTIVSAAENAGWGHIQYNNSGACYSVYASAQEELVMYSEEATMDIEPIHVTEVKLNITELTLEEEETKQLKATVSPADTDFPDVTWSSSNENIASVSSTGLVTAKKAGNATITASTDGKSASCAVTVTEKPVGHGDYTLVKSLSNLKVGDIVVFGNSVAQKTAYEFISTYLSVTEAIIIGDNLDCDNAMEFTMGKDNNYWTFSHNGMLLGGVDKTLSLGGGTTQWTIDIYEGEAEIKPKESDYVIQLNDDRFKLYAADSFYPCELYKRDGQGEDPHDGIEETKVTIPAQKVLRDGQVLIERNGVVYTVTGTVCMGL